MLRTLASVAIFGAVTAQAGGSVQSLSSGAGAAWSYISANGTLTGPATVPGAIHTDLLANGVISDPYVGRDPVDSMRWVALTDWNYTGTFAVAADVLARESVMLVLEGVDTVATVTLNGALVATVSNMFHRSVIPVKDHLRAGTNTLRFAFESKPATAKRGQTACKAEAPGYCPFKYPNKAQNGFDGFNLVRTEQCSASWDWGPGFAPVGVWRELYLHGFDGAVVRDLVVSADAPALRLGPAPGLSASSSAADKRAALARATTAAQRGAAEWSVTATVYLNAGGAQLYNSTIWGGGPAADPAPSPGGAAVRGTVTVTIDGVPGATASAPAEVPAGGVASVTVTVPGVRGVLPWMPNGYGDQPMYVARAVFAAEGAGPPADGAPGTAASAAGGGTAASPAAIPVLPPADGSLSRRFGFRTVELVQDFLPGPSPEHSTSYYTRVSGLPVVWHGSNVVPTDAFQSRVSRSTLVRFVAGLRGAHQNAVRIWGGGVYPKQALYDLLDESGILVWHDAMFSDAQYPVPGAFLASVAKEVQDSVKRIASSPSIAVWAGNNENEGGYKPGEADSAFYGQLTFGTVLDNVTAVDASRPTSGSSPSCGNETAAFPVCGNVRDEFSGDDHRYLYTLDPWDVSIYPRPRAMTEFGLQSWPEFETMRRYVPSDDWFYLSPTMVRRNHHPGGVAEMSDLIAMHWPLPAAMKANASSEAGFRSVLYLSQVYQAYAYSTEIQHLRRIRNECDDGVGGCTQGGMLYWQAQNIWPGASWASIDSDDRYQASLYHVARAYEPVLPSAFLLRQGHGTLFDDDALLGAYVVNDRPETPIEAGILEMSCFSWSGGLEGPPSVAANVSVGAASSRSVLTTTLGRARAMTGCGGKNGTLLTFRVLDVEGEVVGSSTLLASDFHGSPGLLDPKLTVVSVRDDGPAGPPPQFAGPSAYGGSLWRETVRGGHAFNVTVSFEAPAAFVWASTAVDGFWADNAAHFLPEAQGVLGGTRTMRFISRDPTATAADVEATLHLMSVFDTSSEYA